MHSIQKDVDVPWCQLRVSTVNVRNPDCGRSETGFVCALVSFVDKKHHSAHERGGGAADHPHMAEENNNSHSTNDDIFSAPSQNSY